MILHRVVERLAIGVLAVLCLVSPACNTGRAVKSQKAAPEFVLNDSKGTPIRLSDYKGKVVLLNFWATWCHGCVLEIPYFIEFQEKYWDSGFSVIGVSMDEDWKPVKAYVEEKRVNYPVVIDNEGVGKRYGVEAMPMSLLVGRNGTIAVSYTGIVDKDACEAKIRALLQESSQRAGE